MLKAKRKGREARQINIPFNNYLYHQFQINISVL